MPLVGRYSINKFVEPVFGLNSNLVCISLFQSPPPVLSRKGTRSRPNKKIPRFYHSGFDNSTPKIQEPQETTIVREPHTSEAESASQTDSHLDHSDSHLDQSGSMEQADPLLQPEDIKAEPLDVDDSTIEIEDSVVNFSEPDTSMNEEDNLDETFDPIITFEEKSDLGKQLETEPFKKIMVTRQEVLLDVEKVVKIVDVDQIKGSGDILEEDPLNLNEDNSIKITNVESINENKETTPGDSEESKEVEIHTMGFQITSVVSEMEDQKVEDKSPVAVCQIAEVFTETSDEATLKEDLKNMNEEVVPEQSTEETEIEEETLKNEDKSQTSESLSSSMDQVDVDSLENAKDNIENTADGSENNTTAKEGETASAQKDLSDSVQIDEDLNETVEELGETKPVDKLDNKTSEESGKTVDNIDKTEDDADETTDTEISKDKCATTERTEEEMTEKKGEDTDEIVEDTTEKSVDEFETVDVAAINERSEAEESDTLHQEFISQDSSENHNLKTTNQLPIDLNISNSSANNEILEDESFNPDQSLEPKPDIRTSAIARGGCLDEPFDGDIIANDLSNNEDVDLPNDESRTKDPVLANASPYRSPVVISTENEELPMEVCEESFAQEAPSFDQTANSFELVSDVAQNDSSTFGAPGFHIAQVISEQIALNEECRLTSQPMDSGDTCFDGAVTSNNELEMIVNDLTKIVGESHSLESTIENEDIADSLENLLEK